ncbi:MAG TPA: phosphoribosyltransferase family protein [Acidothermaceae bacterium]
MNGFRDRTEAGQVLGELVRAQLRDLPLDDVVVIGLARGGVPVAAGVARALNAALDVCVVRKLGAPGQPEFAFGAIAEDDGRVVEFLDVETVRELGLRDSDVDNVRRTAAAELSRRAHSYRAGRAPLDVRNKHVVLVDDGLATGATMRAAIRSTRDRGAAAVTVAVPVGAPDTVASLRADVDVVCAMAPADFFAVGYHYDDFRPTTDDEIRALLS